MSSSYPRSRSLTVFAGLLLAMLPLALKAQVTIGAPPASARASIFNGGSLGSEVFAETFTTPDAINTQLDALTLYVYSASQTGNFTAYLTQWNSTTNQPTGAPLWMSSPQTTSGHLTDPVTSYTFDTGSLALDAASTYAVFTYGQQTSTSITTSEPGFAGGDVYSGGAAYVLYGPSYSTIPNMSGFSASPLTTSAYLDLAFSATFSPGAGASLTPVPEVSTPGVLIGAGFVSIAGFMERRRRRAAAAAALQGAVIAPVAGA